MFQQKQLIGAVTGVIIAVKPGRTEESKARAKVELLNLWINLKS